MMDTARPEPMHDPADIRTPRLLLRRPVPGDAMAIFEAYSSDPEVVRYLSWLRHRTLDDASDIVARFIAWRSDPLAEQVFMICLADREDAPVGTIGFRRSGRYVSFGYCLARACWGQGLMSEALVAVRDLCMASPEIDRFWAYCDAENPGSARVMEKAGLSFERLERGYSVMPNISPEPRDCLIYAVSKD